jgi:hypothetical protein
MLGARQYPITPVWYFLVWMTPAALLAAIVATFSFLIHRGHTPAAQWLERLRFPIAPTILGTTGILAIELYLETNTSLHAVLRYGTGLPDWVPRAGAASVALAVITLATRRRLPLLIAGTAAAFVVVVAYEYNNLALVVGGLVTALLIWWGCDYAPRAQPTPVPPPP